MSFVSFGFLVYFESFTYLMSLTYLFGFKSLIYLTSFTKLVGLIYLEFLTYFLSFSYFVYFCYFAYFNFLRSLGYFILLFYFSVLSGDLPITSAQSTTATKKSASSLDQGANAIKLKTPTQFTYSAASIRMRPTIYFSKPTSPNSSTNPTPTYIPQSKFKTFPRSSTLTMRKWKETGKLKLSPKSRMIW